MIEIEKLKIKSASIRIRSTPAESKQTQRETSPQHRGRMTIAKASEDPQAGAESYYLPSSTQGHRHGGKEQQQMMIILL
eukprot:scaffold7467_cov187-Amphora_coffeaeformis.AAC.5